MHENNISRRDEQRSARYLMSAGQLHDVPELDAQEVSASGQRIRRVLERTARHWHLHDVLTAPLVRVSQEGEPQ